ncbi:MAG: rhodanese-like domain-containing protein [Geobacteraceae bacterium]|nr:rhodanese-like domain-containing protein [Geobacteraceae bacterium]
MMKATLQRTIFALTCLLLLSTPLLAAEEGFPLRKKYPSLQFISTNDLKSQYDKAAIIDVRSKIEYDVIHINKAAHLPMAVKTFTTDLEKARQKSAPSPLVFYCNGHTCEKSYEAAELATKSGFKGVTVYDAGIFDWAKANPDKTTLLGKTPADKEKLIPKSTFAKKLIGYDDFKSKAAKPNAVVVDIREPIQRDVIPQIQGLRNIPSDRMVDLINKGEFKNKQLLILDAVGKQVEWLQYYLEAKGYSNYLFLEKGVLSAK